MTTAQVPATASAFDKVLDLAKQLVLAKEKFISQATLFTVGYALKGDQSGANQFLYYLNKFIGRTVPDPAPTSLPWEVLAYGCMTGSILWFVAAQLAPWIKPVRQLILHYSMWPMASGPLRKILKDLSPCWVRPFHLDQIREGLITIPEIEKAIRKLKRHSRKFSTKREVFYCSTAHIPLVGLLGFLLRTYKIRFFELEHHSKDPILLEAKPGATPLSFSATRNPVAGSSETALLIEVSYSIDEALVRSTLKKTLSTTRLTLPKPQLSAIKTENDLVALARQFRDEIDSLAQSSPRITRIHLFYAGPTSLVFRFGQLLSQNTDPEVVSYHYKRDAGYLWGISLNRGGYVVQLP